MLPYIVIGISTGSLYGLAGLGLILTYRTSGVLNFAHGTIAAAAAFLFYTLHDTHGMPWPLAATTAMLAFGVLGGLAMERLSRAIADSPEAVVVLLTLGLSLAIQGYLFLQYGDLTRPFPAFLPQTGFHISDVLVTWAQVISAALALAAAVGLYLFLRMTRLGISMRAVVDNRSLTSLTGAHPTRITRTAWMIGTSFAALSGMLLAPTIGLDATLLTLLVVQAFGACAIGLFSSLPLTYLGAIVVGLASNLSTLYFTRRPFTGLPPAVPFLILIAVLLIVPRTKLPRPRQSTGALTPDRPPLPPRASAVLGIPTLVALIAVPHVVGTHLPVYISALTYFVVFASLSLLVWTSGQISLCQLAFVALGATSMGHLSGHGVPWLPAVLLAGLITVPVGACIAIPAIRLSGIYLALLTVGFGIFMQQFAFQTEFMFGTATQVRSHRPHLGFLDGRSDTGYYYVALTAALLTAAVLVGINRSRLGRLLRAMAESPTMLATNGLSVNTSRVIVFCVSAFLAGVGGALTLSQFGSVGGINYGPIQSLLLLAVLAICGTRPLRSPLLAAVLFAIVPGYLHSFDQDRQVFVFGLAAVVSALLLAGRARIAREIAALATASQDRRASGPVRGRTRMPHPVGAAGGLHRAVFAEMPAARVGAHR
jgi:branched-subunit amino acid ABC-type transport system permease component